MPKSWGRNPTHRPTKPNDMRACLRPTNAEQQAQAIDRKRRLLMFLRATPQRLTIESYLCLTRILTAAGWGHDQGFWSKSEQRLPTLEAAVVELNRQVAGDKERLLLQTVAGYRLKSGQPANGCAALHQAGLARQKMCIFSQLRPSRHPVASSSWEASENAVGFFRARK